MIMALIMEDLHEMYSVSFTYFAIHMFGIALIHGSAAYYYGSVIHLFLLLFGVGVSARMLSSSSDYCALCARIENIVISVYLYNISQYISLFVNMYIGHMWMMIISCITCVFFIHIDYVVCSYADHCSVIC